MDEEEQRFCELAVCGKLLVRGSNETKQNWKSRKTCDRVCAGIKSSEKRKRGKKASK